MKRGVNVDRLWFLLALVLAWACPAIAFAHGDTHAHAPAAEHTKAERSAPAKTAVAASAPASCPNGGGACCCTIDCCSGPTAKTPLAPTYVLAPMLRAQTHAPSPRHPEPPRQGFFLTASVGARAPPAFD